MGVIKWLQLGLGLWRGDFWMNELCVLDSFRWMNCREQHPDFFEIHFRGECLHTFDFFSVSQSYLCLHCRWSHTWLWDKNNSRSSSRAYFRMLCESDVCLLNFSRLSLAENSPSLCPSTLSDTEPVAWALGFFFRDCRGGWPEERKGRKCCHQKSLLL